MKRWITTSLIVLTCIAGGLSLNLLRAEPPAKPGAEKAEKGHDRMLAHMKEKLDLTDAQFEKVKAAFESHKATAKPLRRALRDGVTKLKDQLEDKAGEDQLKATLDQVEKSRKDLRAEMDRFHDSLKGVLSVTQQAKAAVAMAEMMKGHGPMGHFGMRGHGLGGKPDKDAPNEEDEDAPPPPSEE